jgi:hypothetical protein
MAIPLAVFGFSLGFFFFGSFFGFFTIIILAVAVVMAVALVLQLIGFYGFWRNYGSRLGIAAFLFGLVATTVYLSATALVVFGGDSVLVFLFVAAWVLLGVMFILDGAAFIVNRHFVLPGASIAAGVLFIIAGGLICSIVLASEGAIVAMPALIIGGIVLASAPIPVMYAQPPQYAPAGAQPPFTP